MSKSVPHIVADRAIAVDLGRDVELAFARITSDFASEDFKGKVVEAGDALERSEADINFAQVLTVRMSPRSASNLAMNVIAMLAMAGRVDLTTLDKFVSGLKEQLAEEANEGEEK